MNNKKFTKYLAVQESGVTNMFDIKTVSQLSGLEKEEIKDIMKNYSRYLEIHNKIKSGTYDYLNNEVFEKWRFKLEILKLWDWLN